MMMLKSLLTVKQVQFIETYMLKSVVEICEKNSINYSLYAGSVLGAVRHKGSIPWDSDIDIIISYEDLDRFISCCNRELISPIYIEYFPKNRRYNQLFPRIGFLGTDIDRIHIDVFLYSALPDNRDEWTKILDEANEVRALYRRKTILFSKNRNLAKKYISTIIRHIRCVIIRESRAEIFQRFNGIYGRFSMADAKYVAELGCNRYYDKEIFLKDTWINTIIVPYENIFVRIPKEFERFLNDMYGDYRKLPPISEQRKIEDIEFWANSSVIEWFKGINVE